MLGGWTAPTLWKNSLQNSSSWHRVSPVTKYSIAEMRKFAWDHGWSLSWSQRDLLRSSRWNKPFYINAFCSAQTAACEWVEGNLHISTCPMEVLLHLHTFHCLLQKTLGRGWQVSTDTVITKISKYYCLTGEESSSILKAILLSPPCKLTSLLRAVNLQREMMRLSNTSLRP